MPKTGQVPGCATLEPYVLLLLSSSFSSNRFPCYYSQPLSKSYKKNRMIGEKLIAFRPPQITRNFNSCKLSVSSSHLRVRREPVHINNQINNKHYSKYVTFYSVRIGKKREREREMSYFTRLRYPLPKNTLQDMYSA